MDRSAHFKRYRLIAVCAVVVTLGIYAALTYAGAGRVVDSAGHPLAGVHVIAVWDAAAFQGVQSSHICFKLHATETDDRGEFFLSPLSGDINPLLLDRRSLLLYYKEGYRNMKDGPVIPFQVEFLGDAAQDTNPHVMVRDERENSERIEYIGHIATGLQCGSETDRRSFALPVLKAMYREAERVAKERTTTELKQLNNFQFWIDELEIGYSRALDKAGELRRQVEIKERAEALKHKPDAEIGMTTKQVAEDTRWGPSRTHELLGGGRRERWDERWTYDEGRYLYFKNRRLIGIQENGQLIGGPLANDKS